MLTISMSVRFKSWYLLMMFIAVMGSSCDSARTSTDDGTVDDPIIKQTVGRIAYSIPSSMVVGQEYKATAIITGSTNDSILFSVDRSGNDLAKFKQGNFKKEDIIVASLMKLSLIDPSTETNFAVVPINTEEQHVDTTSNTVWAWTVKPINQGRNRLLLRATVVTTSVAGTFSRDITVFERGIEVESSVQFTLKRFGADNWQWLASTLLIPIVLWLNNKLRDKREVKKKKQAPIGFNQPPKGKRH